MLTKNIGSLDRVLRIVMGVLLLSLVLVGPKTAFGYIGIIAIATAFINFCPLYAMLGWKTSSK